MGKLPDAVHQRVDALCQEGDALLGEAQFAAARQRYQAAWELLPEPRTDWEAATWVLLALGDAHFLGKDYSAGREVLLQAKRTPHAPNNAFLHLRLGQCEFELGDLDQAAQQLARAYDEEGEDAFEDEDAKYFTFLKTHLEPPVGGWREEAEPGAAPDPARM